MNHNSKLIGLKNYQIPNLSHWMATPNTLPAQCRSENSTKQDLGCQEKHMWKQGLKPQAGNSLNPYKRQCTSSFFSRSSRRTVLYIKMRLRYNGEEKNPVWLSPKVAESKLLTYSHWRQWDDISFCQLRIQLTFHKTRGTGPLVAMFLKLMSRSSQSDPLLKNDDTPV